MDDPNDIGSELLARYVSGEADAQERARVDAWAASAPANRRELDAMLRIWQLGAQAPVAVDVETAWRKVKARMDADDRKGRVIPLWRSPMRWAAAAAVLVGLFFTARWFSADQETFLAGTEITTFTMTDSTRVVLSPGSRIEASMGRERRIDLEGQAWFEVERDEKHPFVVTSGELHVTVLGTGFEVSAYDTAETWSVRVRHGRVRVQVDTQQVELGAGERANLDVATGRLARGGPVTSETWGDRIVRFDNAPMSEVAAQLQRLYHVRVDLSTEALGRCRLTATFENESIEQVLRVIGSTFGLQVERPARDHYVLQGDGC